MNVDNILPNWEDDQEDGSLLDNCPNCGKEYDEIDYEYQICHHCRYIVNHNADE